MSLPPDGRIPPSLVSELLRGPGLVVRERLPEAQFDDPGPSTTPYRVVPRPSPAAAEAAMTINGEEILIHRGNVQFSVGEGQRVVEPSDEFRERFQSFYEEMWRIHGGHPAQLALGIPYPPPRTIEQGAPPIPDDLRERLVDSIVQRAVGAIEYRDGFFDDEDE